MENRSIAQGLRWKLLERFGVLGIQFVLQIVLARLLSPEHYGTLTIMVVFTNLANIFIQTGFNTALVQNKNVTEADYSSVFWVTSIIAFMVYIFLFFLAPLIENFYNVTGVVVPFRVLCLLLFPGTFNSIQLAKISRELDFKKVFKSNLIAVVISGLIGISVAICGGGLWALVIQNLLNTTVSCIVMASSTHWYPRLVCNYSRVKILFSFGWKLLVSNLLDTLFQNIQSLVIGKKYNQAMLGYYSRGEQFPSFLINAINSSVQSVLLPSMSAQQDDRQRIKKMMRNSVVLSSYIIFPMMAGLAAVSPALIGLLLTEKWLQCVPFMQINCITYAFYPIHTSNLQAINAMGRSDIYLKLEVVKKVVSLSILAIAVFGFESPLAIAMSGAIGVPIGLIINSYPNKKLIGYSFLEQMRDILPSLILAFLMGISTWLINLLELNNIITLGLQIVYGVIVYVLLSILLHIRPYKILLDMIKRTL